jgi:hypothetical protein
MKKHIICHIHSLDHPSVFKILKALVNNDSLFTGEKIATITKVTKEIKVHDLVVSILTKLGYTVLVVANDDMRETNHFFNTALPLLLSKSKDGVLCYCHSKGITYHPDSEDGQATALWTDVLIENVINQANKLPFDNVKYKTFGSCRIIKNNFLPGNLGEKFSYIGTFFWVRIELLVGKTFKPISKFYLEALPGLVATQSESFNQGPTFTSGDSPYKLESWAKRGINSGLFQQD